MVRRDARLKMLFFMLTWGESCPGLPQLFRRRTKGVAFRCRLGANAAPLSRSFEIRPISALFLQAPFPHEVPALLARFDAGLRQTPGIQIQRAFVQTAFAFS